MGMCEYLLRVEICNLWTCLPWVRYFEVTFEMWETWWPSG